MFHDTEIDVLDAVRVIDSFALNHHSRTLKLNLQYRRAYMVLFFELIGIR